VDGLSNFRVRQALNLRRPQRQKDFIGGLATYLNDDTRTARVGWDKLVEASGTAPNTAKKARRELQAQGDLLVVSTGVGQGHVNEWTALCLPEDSRVMPPRKPRKGVNSANRVSAVDPLLNGKGVNPAQERGSNGIQKGGQTQGADLQQTNTLERLAKPYGLAAASRLAQDQGQDKSQNRVGDGVDDEAQPVDAGTGPQSNPLANSQDRRVHQGPETVAGQAQQSPLHNSESPAAGGDAHAGEAAPSPRKCDYAECLTPDKPLSDGERRHIGCGVALRRAERAQAAAAAS
jgi:hypothetical protein